MKKNVKSSLVILIFIVLPLLALSFLCITSGSGIFKPQDIISRLSLRGNIAIQGILAPNDAGIFVYDQYTNTLRRLTPSEILVFNSSWSPDGTMIAFVYSDASRTDFQLALFDPKSGDIQSLVNNFESFRVAQNTSIAWSPDGQRILVGLIASDGSNRMVDVSILDGTYNLTPLVFNVVGNSISSIEISWSPGEVPIAGVVNIGSEDDIYLVSSDLSSTTWIAHGSSPTWRPGTDSVSYLCSNASDDIPSLCIYSTELNTETVLIRNFSFEDYAWSPDGNFILYIDARGENEPVFLALISIETGNRIRLRSLTPNDGQRWFNGPVSWTNE